MLATPLESPAAADAVLLALADQRGPVPKVLVPMLLVMAASETGAPVQVATAPTVLRARVLARDLVQAASGSWPDTTDNKGNRLWCGANLPADRQALLRGTAYYQTAARLAAWLPLTNIFRLNCYLELHWRVWRDLATPLPQALESVASMAWQDAIRTCLERARAVSRAAVAAEENQ